MDRKKDVIYKALCDSLAKDGITVKGIMERNDVAIRELEGLQQYKGWYRADFLPEPPSPVTEMTENGIVYTVDVENGQKTGFFLDQKYNRLAVAKIAKGKKVLDCFTHTGSFALNAAKGGAAHVTAVDVSQFAVDTARENAVKNGLDGKMDFVCADVFDLLPELAQKGSDYDFIILDPPAFTKNRKTVDSAQRGYKEINYRAMKLLPRGGYLATCSCSHFMYDDMFRKMLAEAAHDACVTLRQI
jgi:23S rRNA (cytosine1962-C5)-methyltransferase